MDQNKKRKTRSETKKETLELRSGKKYERLNNAVLKPQKKNNRQVRNKKNHNNKGTMEDPIIIEDNILSKHEQIEEEVVREEKKTKKESRASRHLIMSLYQKSFNLLEKIKHKQKEVKGLLDSTNLSKVYEKALVDSTNVQKYTTQVVNFFLSWNTNSKHEIMWEISDLEKIRENCNTDKMYDLTVKLNALNDKTNSRDFIDQFHEEDSALSKEYDSIKQKLQIRRQDDIEILKKKIDQISEAISSIEELFDANNQENQTGAYYDAIVEMCRNMTDYLYLAETVKKTHRFLDDCKEYMSVISQDQGAEYRVRILIDEIIKHELLPNSKLLIEMDDKIKKIYDQSVTLNHDKQRLELLIVEVENVGKDYSTVEKDVRRQRLSMYLDEFIRITGITKDWISNQNPQIHIVEYERLPQHDLRINNLYSNLQTFNSVPMWIMNIQKPSDNIWNSLVSNYREDNIY